MFASPRALGTVALSATAAGIAVGVHHRRLSGLRRELAAAQQAATHDPLTGLLNRAGLTRAWPTLAPRRPVVALVDLDKFKAINDQYGHAAGDLVLRAVAGRLHSRAPGVVARLGGDEFVAVFASTNPERVAAMLAGAVGEPVTLPGGARVSVGASVGVARTPTASLGEVLAQADAAMYRAKATGAVVATYDPRRDDHTSPATEPRPAVRIRDLTVDFSALLTVGGVR